jgi:hypothetical protein
MLASSSPPRDPAIQIPRASYRGSSSPLVGIVSILSRLFPPHIGEVHELLVRATALADAAATAAIAIAHRPSLLDIFISTNPGIGIPTQNHSI